MSTVTEELLQQRTDPCLRLVRLVDCPHNGRTDSGDDEEDEDEDEEGDQGRERTRSQEVDVQPAQRAEPHSESTAVTQQQQQQQHQPQEQHQSWQPSSSALEANMSHPLMAPLLDDELGGTSASSAVGDVSAIEPGSTMAAMDNESNHPPRRAASRASRARAAESATESRIGPLLPTMRIRADTDWRHDSLMRRALFFVLDAQTPEQLEDLRTRRARRLGQQLTRYLIAAACFTSLSLFMIGWLLVRGWVAMAYSHSAKCNGPMRDWLPAYVWLHAVGPASMPIALLIRRAAPQVGQTLLVVVWPMASLLLLTWCLWAIVCLPPPSSCGAFQGLTSEFFALEVIALLVLGVVGMYWLGAQLLIDRLNQLLSRGHTTSEAVGLIAEVPTCEAPASEECVICLGCIEDVEEDEDDDDITIETPLAAAEVCSASDLERCSDGGALVADLAQHGGSSTGLPLSAPTAAGMEQSPCSSARARPKWRRLQCGHHFHEECLFQWLRKAKRCPMCRAHVRKGHLRTARAASRRERSTARRVSRAQRGASQEVQSAPVEEFVFRV